MPLVDGLEVVQIQQAHGQQTLVLARLEDGMCQPLGQCSAVVQPGQGIVGGLPRYLLLQVPRFTGIAEHQHAAHMGAIAAPDRGCGELNGVALARTVHQHLVDGLQALGRGVQCVQCRAKG